MKHTQNTNQEQKKHFLTSHKSIRFTAALCAAAVLVGGVAYAATPDAIAAEPTTAASESTFTDVVVTTFDETEFPSSDLIRLNASIDEAIILTVIHQKVDAAAADQKFIPSGWPVESRIVSTEFNPTADPSISDGRKHEGMDISTKSQIIPIYATAAGTVVTANFRSDYGNQVITQNPTCTIRGKAESTCVECGYLYEVVDLGTQWDAHTWNEGKITIEPNCGQEGVKDITCLECGMVTSEILPIVGEHTYNDGEVLQAPTCLNQGIRLYTCTTCGWTYDEAIAVTDHTWGEGIQNTDGTVTYFCTVCNQSKTEGTPTEAPLPTTQPAPTSATLPVLRDRSIFSGMPPRSRQS